MHLQTLSIQNVRNLQPAQLTFGPGFNFVYGDNGAGKTALLEAIFILARGRSFRSHRVAPVISHQQSELVVRGGVIREEGSVNTIAIAKTRNGSTEIRVGGQKERRVSSLAKMLPVQTLLPEASELIFGSPAIRRGFVDWGLFHVEHRFLGLYSQYRRALAQRNAWLKSPEAQNNNRVLTDPWAQQLIAAAVPLQEIRADYVARLQTHIDGLLQRLYPNEQREMQVEVAYRSGGLTSYEEAEKKLVESLPRDVKSGTTHRGPHRSDLVIKTGEHLASDVLSRGQAKLLAGACILAQAEYLYQCSGTKSIFLVDDFGAELDPRHWQVFLRTLVNLNSQVIATGTKRADAEALEQTVKLAVDQSTAVEDCTVGDDTLAPKATKLFHVEHGVLTDVGQLESKQPHAP